MIDMLGNPAATSSVHLDPHREYPGCVTQGCSRMELPAPLSVGFNDPEAWGYCEYCALLVAAKDGKLLPHSAKGRDGGCNGSGNPPSEVPEVAVPRPFVSLRRPVITNTALRWMSGPGGSGKHMFSKFCRAQGCKPWTEGERG